MRTSDPDTRFQRRKSSIKEYVSDAWWRNRVLLGFFTVALHTLGCMFYSGMAEVHLYIKHDPIAPSMLNIMGVDVLGYFDAVVMASAALAVLHGLAIVGPCYWWFAMRRPRSRVYAGAAGAAAHDRTPQPPRSRLQRVLGKLEHWDRVVEHKTGADTYELLVFVEIALQTYQTHKMSRLVATHWINHLMVLAIIANCWFMPAVSIMFRNKPVSFVKVVHLGLDAAIEIVYGMVIPLVIFYPYYRDRYHILHDSPFIGFYDDTWYIGAIQENRQLYVSSWLDFVSKLSPGLSLLLRLIAFQAQRMEHEIRARSLGNEAAAAAPAESMARKKRFVIGVMALWGLGVLAAHVAGSVASLTGRDPGCLIEPIPLGATRYSCAVLEVSCTQKHITGMKSEIDGALSHVDPLMVQGLIFSHCEVLAMPPRLKTFQNLIQIKIFNSSIAEWNDDAALTAHDHPNFKALYFVVTNMSRVPDGALASNSPPLLNNVKFCATNLTAIPDGLFDKWRSVRLFFLELSPGITEFPLALRRATTPSVVSLAANAIAEIPDDIFVTHNYQGFLVSGNPLERFPAEVGSMSGHTKLMFSSTKIATVPPSWLAAAGRFMGAANPLLAMNTPLCASLKEIRTRTPASDVATTLPWIFCENIPGLSSYYYPMSLEKQWRSRNRE